MYRSAITLATQGVGLPSHSLARHRYSEGILLRRKTRCQQSNRLILAFLVPSKGSPDACLSPRLLFENADLMGCASLRTASAVTEISSGACIPLPSGLFEG